LVSYGRPYAEGVREYDGEEDIGPDSKAVTGDWRKLHNEELHDLYSSLIRVIKSRMKWAGHVAHTGKQKKKRKEIIWKTWA
jgi:hypothetical protein